MMDLDHIFICTSTGAPQADRLIELGLTEGPRNAHPGQGTANRRFFFEHTMLELLWVHDEAEAQSAVIAPTLLWERWRSPETGYSPFGICVRASADQLSTRQSGVLPETWAYKPPYLPSGLQIDVAQNGSYPAEPMLFQIPFSRQPKQQGEESEEAAQHPLGVKNITRVILHLPVLWQYSPAMGVLLKTNWLAIEPEEGYHITLEFDHCHQQMVMDFGPELPLTMKW
jgi:hypothetical protein